MKDTYNTITSIGEGLYKEKGSKFLGFCFPLETESEVKEVLARFHKEYHNARHVCYAYKLGYDENSPYRINDDGEPSGTAGKPIFGQILSHELTDVLIIVVRYFGGTKLGVSGLINAYKSASLEAINDTSIVEMIRSRDLVIRYDFAMTNEAMRIVKEHQLKVKSQDYDTACLLTLDIRLSDYEKVSALFDKVHGISIVEDD